MGLKGRFAQQQSRAAHVGSGSNSAFRRCLLDVRITPCERTYAGHCGMSHSGQLRTHAPQRNSWLFDYLVGGREQLVRYGEAKHARRPRIDD
jgi:hypothetical protein